MAIKALVKNDIAQTASYWAREAKKHFQRREYEESIYCIGLALRVNPQASLFWFQKGDILFRMNKKEEALNAYTTAATIKPNNKRYLLGVALVLRAMERHEDAILYYERLVKLQTSSTRCAVVLFYMTESLKYLGRTDEAVSLEKKAWAMVC